MNPHIWNLIDDSLQRHAERPAWTCRLTEGRRRVVHYQDIRESALATASKLREAGVGPGDIVAVAAPNGPEWGVAALAVWRVGAILAPIHTGYSDEEMRAQVEALQPKLFLLHGVDRGLSPAQPISLARDPANAQAEQARTVEVDPRSKAVRLYTSGSTAQPKMVRLSHANISSNVIAASRIEDINKDDRFLSLLPLSHAFEMTGGMLLPLYCGATIVVPRVIAAGEILASMSEEKITIVLAVPRLYRNIMQGLEKRFREGSALLRLYRQLLRLAPIGLRRQLNFPLRRKLGGNIKAWISGGSRLDPAIAAFFRDLGLPLRQGYGLTESGPVVSVQDAFPSILDSVGRPLDGVEVRIDQPDDHGSGELLVRGPNVMLGYVDQQQTDQVIEPDGWFHTGDLARIAEDGSIVLTGRIKRLIVSEAGKNIYPEDLENRLERIEGVKEAGVIEIDNAPAALMAMEGEGEERVARAREVLRMFNQAVSSHNHIRRFAVVDELPRTPLGKVALKNLPEIFAENEVR